MQVGGVIGCLSQALIPRRTGTPRDITRTLITALYPRPIYSSFRSDIRFVRSIQQCLEVDMRIPG